MTTDLIAQMARLRGWHCPFRKFTMSFQLDESTMVEGSLEVSLLKRVR